MNIITVKKNNLDYKKIFKEYLSEKAKTDSYYLVYRKFYSHKRPKAIYLCYEENTPIAFITIGCSRRTMIILDIYVNPLFRGRGIANHLIKNVENNFYKYFDNIIMHSRKDSNELKHILSSLGYIPTLGHTSLDRTNLFDKYKKKLSHKYRYLIIGIDDTIFDFKKSYELKVSNLLEFYNVESSEENIKAFIETQNQVLAEYKRGEISNFTFERQQYKRFFLKQNIEIDPVKAEEILKDNSWKTFILRKSAKKLLKKLSGKYIIIGISRKNTKFINSLLEKNKIYSNFSLTFSFENDNFQNKEVFKLISSSLSDSLNTSYAIISTTEEDMEFGIDSKIDTYFLNLSNIKKTHNDNIYTRKVKSFNRLYSFLKK